MKLDLDFIKKILDIMNSNDSHQTNLGVLLNGLDINREDHSQIDKLEGHIKIIHGVGIIGHDGSDLGFLRTLGRAYPTPFESRNYEMTMKGYQILEALNNDNLMSKLKNYFSEIGISALKNAPSYLIGIATEYALKS